jgi:hypothetical protein
MFVCLFQFMFELGILVYQALDFMNADDEEVKLSPDLDQLISDMTYYGKWTSWIFTYLLYLLFTFLIFSSSFLKNSESVPKSSNSWKWKLEVDAKQLGESENLNHFSKLKSFKPISRVLMNRVRTIPMNSLCLTKIWTILTQTYIKPYFLLNFNSIMSE